MSVLNIKKGEKRFAMSFFDNACQASSETLIRKIDCKVTEYFRNDQTI